MNLAETLPVLPEPHLRIEPWRDAVVDRIGFPLRGPYVEEYWLGILGPTSTWLLRRLDAALASNDDGVTLDLATLAGSLGLNFEPGQSGPFGRAVQRCVIFGLAQPVGARLAVRRSAPPLSARQVSRLPLALQEGHGRSLRLSERRAS